MNERPIYLDLLRIRLPLPGLISFAHRVSGVVLFFSIPYFLDVLERSVSGAYGFSMVRQQLRSLWFVPFIFITVWSLCHHLLAGIRFLLMDLDIGLGKGQSRLSAAWVGGAAIIFTLFLMLEIYS